MVQRRVRHLAELKTKVALAPPGTDNQQVRLCRGIQQDPAGGPLGRPSTQFHRRVLRSEPVQRRLQDLHRPLLVQTGGFSRKQQMVDRLVYRAAPGPHRVQGRAAALCLLEGEAQGLRVLPLLADSESDPPEHPVTGLVVVTAAQHDHGAVCAGGHLEADRAEQQLGDTTAAARSQNQGTGVPPFMGAVGTSADNAACESFHASLKREPDGRTPCDRL